MDNENKNELFSLRLNEEGVGYLLRYIKLVLIFIILGWLFTLVVITRDIFLLIQDYSVYENTTIRTYYQLYPILSLAATTIFIFQLIYGQKLARRLKIAIHHSDEMVFNSAFRYFNLVLLTAIIITFISLLMIALDFYIVFFITV
jgi:hypothetical protein